MVRPSTNHFSLFTFRSIRASRRSNANIHTAIPINTTPTTITTVLIFPDAYIR